MPNIRRMMMAAAGVSTTAQFAIWGAGRNSLGGSLGDGTATDRSSPVQAGDKSDWTGFDIGGNYGTGAVNSSGELWTWGNNGSGRLGLGDTTDRSSPTQVGSLTDWAAVASGQNYMMAVKTDGTLWTWGANGDGTLGLGDTTARSSPTQVGSLTDWSSAAGAITGSINNCMFAIKTDGTLWVWGDNGSDFNLGLGDSTKRSSPTQSGSVSTWAFVNATGQAGAAIRTDGTLWTWGHPSSGQLGNGQDSTPLSSPTQIGSLTNWSTINGGGPQFNAVKTDGTLWGWGANTSGQLGLGDTTVRSSPVQVGSLTDWSKATSLYNTAGAVKTDGTFWTWGDNYYGAQGNGTTTSSSSPAQVGSLTDYLEVGGDNAQMRVTRSA
jgi:alpha-tubulin suppressor-like RCC1 family protein